MLEECESVSEIDSEKARDLKRILEALLFASSEPLSAAKIREIASCQHPVSSKQVRDMVEELNREYASQMRAFKIVEIAQGFSLCTYEEFAPYIGRLQRQKRGDRLSNAATEVLAIIAYRQPISRAQIDAIRGVDSSGPLAQLLERQLVEAVGKSETPGRPTLYGTTKEFLKHYGLKDLNDLKLS